MKTLILFLFACTTAFAEAPDDRFEKASRAMSDGDYGEAAFQLRELVADGEFSHGSLHNLGNAEWKVARPGHVFYGSDWPYIDRHTIELQHEVLTTWKGLDTIQRSAIARQSAKALFPRFALG